MSVDPILRRGIRKGYPAHVYQREISRAETARPATTATPWMNSQRVIGCWRCGSGGGQVAYNFPSVPRMRYIDFTSILAVRNSRSITRRRPLLELSAFCTTAFRTLHSGLTFFGRPAQNEKGYQSLSSGGSGPRLSLAGGSNHSRGDSSSPVNYRKPLGVI